MVISEVQRVIVFFFLLPIAALEVLFLILRHGKNAHPLFLAALLQPFIYVAAQMFLANPATFAVFVVINALGDLMLASIAVPILAKVTGRRSPAAVAAAMAVLCAGLIVLLPFELIGRNNELAAWRNSLRFWIVWLACGYFIASMRRMEAGIPRTGVFLYSVLCLLNLPGMIIGRLFSPWTGSWAWRDFFSYNQSTVNYQIGSAVFTAALALLFIFMKPRPALAAVRESAFDPETLKALLSRREREIALLLCRGKSYRQIADMLFISRHTVRNHCHNIFEKCGVSSRYELSQAVGALLTGERREGDGGESFTMGT